MVYILLGTGFEEAEAVVPCDILRRAGIDVKFVGLEALTVTGAHGISVQADMLLPDVQVEDITMLLLPGGSEGVECIRENLYALSLIQDAWAKGCFLAAICAAPTLLASLAILDRRRAVCYPGLEAAMGSAVIQDGESVVADGRLITARGPGSAFEFGIKLVEVLMGAETAQEIQHALCLS